MTDWLNHSFQAWTSWNQYRRKTSVCFIKWTHPQPPIWGGMDECRFPAKPAWEIRALATHTAVNNQRRMQKCRQKFEWDQATQRKCVFSTRRKRKSRVKVNMATNSAPCIRTGESETKGWNTICNQYHSENGKATHGLYTVLCYNCQYNIVKPPILWLLSKLCCRSTKNNESKVPQIHAISSLHKNNAKNLLVEMKR